MIYSPSELFGWKCFTFMDLFRRLTVVPFNRLDDAGVIHYLSSVAHSHFGLIRYLFLVQSVTHIKRQVAQVQYHVAK